MSDDDDDLGFSSSPLALFRRIGAAQRRRVGDVASQLAAFAPPAASPRRDDAFMLAFDAIAPRGARTVRARFYGTGGDYENADGFIVESFRLVRFDRYARHGFVAALVVDGCHHFAMPIPVPRFEHPPPIVPAVGRSLAVVFACPLPSLLGHAFEVHGVVSCRRR